MPYEPKVCPICKRYDWNSKEAVRKRKTAVNEFSKMRKKAGLTLKEMGARLGISAAYVWAMETGERTRTAQFYTVYDRLQIT
jgi:DNA-binding XRE family transcriptional regulator